MVNSQFPELPPEIEWIPSEGSGFTYRLPRRELGPLRWLAVPLVLMAIFVTGFMGVWTWMFTRGFIGAFGPWGMLAGLVGLPGIAVAGSLLMIAGALVIGYAEIRYQNGKLTSIERVGIFRRRRRIPTEDLVRLSVVGATDDSLGSPTSFLQKLSGFAVLMAIMNHGKPKWLVVGYRRTLLLQLAQHLAVSLQVESDDYQSEPVEVLDRTVPLDGRPHKPRRQVERPAETTIELQESSAGFTFIVPALGVWKGSGGLFAFSLIWCGFVSVFTTVVLCVFFFADQKPDVEPMAIFASVLTLMWIAGAGMLTGAIHMGRMQAAIAVANGELKLIQTGLFGVKRRAWNLQDLAEVRVGASGMEVNNQPVMQLQMIPREGAKFGMLTGRDTAELEWMAMHLNCAVTGEDPSTLPMEELPEEIDET